MRRLRLTLGLAACSLIFVLCTAPASAIYTNGEVKLTRWEGLFPSESVTIINPSITSAWDGQTFDFERLNFQTGKDIPRQSVPEPKTLFLLGSGLLSFAGIIRKRVIS